MLLKLGLALIATVVSLKIQAAELGKQLQLATNPSNGHFQLGVHYAYDAGTGEKFTISWNILFGTALSQSEIAALPAQMKWNIFDPKSGSYLDNWSVRPTVARDTLKLGTISLDGDLAKAMIGNQSSNILVFADGAGHALYHLDVGQLCLNHPSYFSNLTNTLKRCDQVTFNEIEDAQNQFCQEEKDDLTNYLKRGLITCATAKSQFKNKGCGDFICN